MVLFTKALYCKKEGNLEIRGMSKGEKLEMRRNESTCHWTAVHKMSPMTDLMHLEQRVALRTDCVCWHAQVS